MSAANSGPRVRPSEAMEAFLVREVQVREDDQSRRVLQLWENVKRARLSAPAVENASERASSPAETIAPENPTPQRDGDRSGMSKWRYFFGVNQEDPSRRDCILKPEFSCALNHTVTLSNDLTVLSRHMASAAHKLAYAHFESLLVTGKEASHAASETIVWAQEEWNKKSNSQARLAFSTEAKEELILKESRAEAALFTFFVMSGTAFRQIESQALKEVFSSFNWTHVAPSRTRFSTTLLDECYGRVVQQRDVNVRNVDFFSITMDGATLTHKKSTRFVSLTVHFIDRQWVLHNFVLALISLPGDHPWNALAHAVAIRLDNLMPQGSTLVSTVTDQGANYQKAAFALHSNSDTISVSGLGPDDWEEPPPRAAEEETATDPTVAHQCTAHRASNAALDAMKDPSARHMISIIDRAREMIVHVRESPTLRDKFLRYQRERLTLSFPTDKQKQEPRILTLDVKTRWLSMHDMLQRFVECSSDIQLLILEGEFDHFRSGVISAAEFLLLKDCCITLAPVAEFVRQIEGEAYVTIAHVPVMVAALLKKVKPADFASELPLFGFQQALYRALHIRLGWMLTRVNLGLAGAALSPAFGHLTFIGAELRDAVWEELANWAVKFPAVPPQPTRDTPFFMRGLRAEPTIEDIKRDLRKLRSNFEESPPVNEEGELDPTAIRTDEKFHVLNYYKSIETNVPDLKRILHLPRIALSAPATSASSEREFSIANRIVTAHRSRLSDDKIEKLCIIQSHINRVGEKNFIDFFTQAIREERRAQDSPVDNADAADT